MPLYFLALTIFGDRYQSQKFLFLIFAFRGHAVEQLVEALRYKPEGRGVDPDGIFY